MILGILGIMRAGSGHWDEKDEGEWFLFLKGRKKKMLCFGYVFWYCFWVFFWVLVLSKNVWYSFVFLASGFSRLIFSLSCLPRS